MNKNEIFSFLNANPVFHLATVEGNKPHVRVCCSTARTKAEYCSIPAK
jgi:uncharacterized pyridoxamine 5'-phosphate oxidase family protein